MKLRQRPSRALAADRPQASPAPSLGASPITPDQRDHFFREGFLDMRGAISPAHVAMVNAAVDRAWADRSIYNPLTVTAFPGTPDYAETYLREAPLEARNGSYKLNHLYLYDHSVMDFLLSDPLQAIVSDLIGGTPLLFNGLNLEYGSQQRYHFDTLYMPPRSKDKMVVLWFALEDVTVAAGALQYYPKSHLIPPFIFSHGEMWAIDSEMPAFDRYMEAQIAERQLTPTFFEAKAGDMFIWHSQLYHGGSPILDPSKTRKSMVAHYWRAEDLPSEQCWEARPGRYVMDPRWMCVASNFRSAGYDHAAVTAGG